MTETPDERVDLARTPACEELEEDLANAVQVQREGGDLAKQYPALARHLDHCEWCRTTLAELMKKPDVSSEAEPHVEGVERYLVAALAEPEQIVRVRAVKRLAASRQIGAVALAALADAAADDPEEEVRAAARRALEELGAAVVIGTLSPEEGELRLVLEGLPPSFEQTTPVVAVPGTANLLSAEDAVREGRLDVRLGQMLDPATRSTESSTLERVVVLKPQA